MPKQYIIEHGKENNRWLYKIEGGDRKNGGSKTRCFKPGVEEALVFKKDEAITMAKEWNARAWQVKGGVPVKQVWPE